MMRTREQLFKRLQVAEAMRAFISQHPGGVEELRAQLKKVEAKLATAQKVVADGSEQLCRVEGEKEVIRAETDILKKEKEALEGQVNEVGREILQLKRDTEELWASLAAQKESEDLRAGLAAQKEEMEARFAAQKKEMEEEYQQQADEMYFFVYHCCMKKHGIMHDIPSFPSDEEDSAPGGPSS